MLKENINKLMITNEERISTYYGTFVSYIYVVREIQLAYSLSLLVQ